MKDLRCERNLGNYNDTFVVTVKKRTVPGASGPHPTIYIIYINCSPSLVIWWCDSIKCKVTANKWYSSNLPQVITQAEVITQAGVIQAGVMYNTGITQAGGITHRYNNTGITGITTQV